jgi:histidinol-phosphate aminotransferase
MLGEHRDLPNLFVARTFSKAYGLAGLRLGVLVGSSEQMRAVRRVCSPYNVNAVALTCLPAAIGDQEYIRHYVAEVLESRSRLEEVLINNDIQFWPSQANFILMKIGASSSDAARFVDLMRRRGILVRDRSTDHGCEGCVRITVGPRQHADLLISALGEAFQQLRAVEGVSQR